MQPSANDAKSDWWRNWSHCPNTILVLVAVIEILVALMGFASHFAEIFQVLAGIAGVVLIGVGLNMIVARWTLSAEPDSEQSQCRGQLGQKPQKLLLGVLLAVAITFLPPFGTGTVNSRAGCTAIRSGWASMPISRRRHLKRRETDTQDTLQWLPRRSLLVQSALVTDN